MMPVPCGAPLADSSCIRPSAHEGPHGGTDYCGKGPVGVGTWVGPSDESIRQESYRKLAKDIAETVIQKQAAYGDSFGRSGRVMEELFPDGIATAQMHDALTIVRILDKLFRIATDRDALGESPYKDIMGYALLATERIERQRAKLDSAPAR
jgi:hypothetical protein